MKCKCEQKFCEYEPSFATSYDIRTGILELCSKIRDDINHSCHNLKETLSSVFAQSRTGQYIKNKKKSANMCAKKRLSYKMSTSGGSGLH